MIRVFVFVSGLVLGVPDAGKDPKGMTFLLGRGHGLGADGAQVAHHVTTLTNGSTVFEIVAPTALRIARVSGDGKAPAGTLELGNELDHFFELRDFVSSSANVKKACRGAKWATSCALDGQPMLAASLRIEGGWTLSARTKCGGTVEPGLTDSSLWRGAEVRYVADQLHWIGKPKKLADIFGFWVDVKSLDEVKVALGGVDYRPIQLAAPEECTRLVGLDPPPDLPRRCAVLEVTSLVDHGGHAYADLPPYDAHTPPLYDLLSSRPSHSMRGVPVLANDARYCPTVKDPPFTRCKPTVLQ